MGNWVFENVPDTYWHVHDAPNQTNGGPVFRVNPPAYCTALRWWRDGVGRGTPTIIGLWRVSDQFELAHVTPVEDNFNVGWQVSVLDTPVVLAGATDYLVAAFFPSDGGLGSSNSGEAIPGTPPVGIVIQSQQRHYHDGPPYQFPSSTITNYRQALDAYIEFGEEPPGPEPPATPGDVQSSLDTWLNPGGANFAGSALDLILQQGAGNSSKLDVLLSRLTEDVANKLIVLLEDYGIDARNFFSGITTKVDNLALAQADIFERIGEFTGVSLFGYAAEILRWLNGLNQRPNVGAPDAFDVVETTYNVDLLWEQPADEYIVFVDTIPPIRSQEVVATIDTRHRLGWYSTYGAGAASQRGYIDFPICRIPAQNGKRMPGLLLTTGAGSAGHVQAFTYKEPTDGP